MTIDLLAAESYTSGHPIDQLMWLQENEPVYWHHEQGNGPGFWALTRYDQIRAVHGNAKGFSNWPSDAIQDEISLGDNETHFHLIMSDPPHHTLHRRFLSEELAPRSVTAMTESVESVAHAILDEIIEQGSCDLIEDVAGKLSAYVTADLMGLPRLQIAAMYHVADRLVNAVDLTSGDGLAASIELQDYAQSVWADRRANPRQDAVTRYAHGEVDGREIDFEQFFLDFNIIFNAAGDTTRNALGGGLDVLFSHPDQLARLRADRSLVRSAVEELLRFVSPLTYQRRTATADVEIGGQLIKAGQKVASFFAAANRDPRVFAKPLDLDLERTPNNHLSFGFGPHFCLGAHVARLELRAMLRALIERMPDMEPTGQTEWHVGEQPIVVGPSSLPVRFTPGSRVGSERLLPA